MLVGMVVVLVVVIVRGFKCGVVMAFQWLLQSSVVISL